MSVQIIIIIAEEAYVDSLEHPENVLKGREGF